MSAPFSARAFQGARPLALSALLGYACFLFSYHPALAPLSALPQGGSLASQLRAPWALWLCFLAHQTLFECALSAGAAGLMSVVFPRRDLVRASLAFLVCAPLISLSCAAMGPIGLMISGPSAPVFFICCFASVQGLFCSRVWPHRIACGACLCMLLSRALFGLVLYAGEHAQGQQDIISRCLGALLGLAAAALAVAVSRFFARLEREKQQRLRSLG